MESEGARPHLVLSGVTRVLAQQVGLPTSSLAGWIDLLEERAADGETQSILSHMRVDVARLAAITTRIERISGGLRAGEFDPHAVAERVAAHVAPGISMLASRIAVEVEPPSGAMCPLRGDAVLIEWVVELLVTLAIEAVASAGGRVLIASESREGGAGRICVAYEAQGTGAARNREGTLSIVRHIVEGLHRGELVVESADQRASFDVILR